MYKKGFKFQLAVLMLCVMAFCVSACAQKKEGKFVVKGKAAASIEKIYVVNVNMDKMVDTVTVSNGEFEFVTQKTSDDVFYAFIADKEQVVVVSDGNEVKLDMTTHKATGTPLNDKLSAWADRLNVVMNDYTTLKKQYDATTDENVKKEVANKMSHLNDDLVAEGVKIVDANQDNCLPAYLLVRLCQDLDFVKLDAYAKSGAAYTKHPLFRYVEQYLEYLRPSMAFIGKTYIDVEGEDFNGKQHKLSEYVGKGNYVLVDFWASWCGPCMQEMPTVKACWEKYKVKGFDVVGISLDNDADKWKNAVSNGGYNWKHISDLNGWRSAAAKAYGVQSIPWNILCDGEGKIIGANLRGRELERKLAALYD